MMILCSFFLILYNITFCYGNNVWTDGLLGAGMDALGSLLCDLNQNSTLDLGRNLTLHWYDTNTGEHKSYFLENAGIGLLNEESFDVTVPWVFFISGYGTNLETETTASFIDSLLTVQDKYIIYLDHSYLTYSDSNLIDSYKRSVHFVDPVARNLKNKFFMQMFVAGVQAHNIHVIGHSLGGQIMGELGRQLNEEQIALGKCTGIDPAGPCFYESSKNPKLSANDCKFVEQIHCDAGQRGTNNKDSHFEMYANCAGKIQPFCNEITTSTYAPSIFLQSLAHTTGMSSSCSHMYCLEIYRSTIDPNVIYKAKNCADFKSFKKGTCSSEEVLVGFYSDPNRTYDGSYYFKSVEDQCDIY